MHWKTLSPKKAGRVTTGYTSTSRSKRDGVVQLVCRIGFRRFGFHRCHTGTIQRGEHVRLRHVACGLEHRKLDPAKLADLVLIAVDVECDHRQHIGMPCAVPRKA